MSEDALRDALVERLEEENDILRERVRQLEKRLGESATEIPIELCLSPHESAMLAHMMGRKMCSKNDLMAALYGNLPDVDEPEIKIVDVFICKIRKKLKPFQIEIKTVWGRGFALPAASKQKLRDLARLARAA